MKNQGYIQEAQRRGSRTDEGKQGSGSVSLVQEDEAATRLLSMKEKDFIESANILCENLDRKVHIRTYRNKSYLEGQFPCRQCRFE